MSMHAHVLNLVTKTAGAKQATMLGPLDTVLAILSVVIIIVVVVMGAVASFIYRRSRLLNASSLPAGRLGVESASSDSTSRAADATNLVNITVGVFRAVGGILAFTGAVAIGVVSYTQQQEQFRSKQERELRNTNADRFKTAIDLLADTEVSRTEGAIIIMEALLRDDPATFAVPVRNAYRAKLIGLQSSIGATPPIEANPRASGGGKARAVVLLPVGRLDVAAVSTGVDGARFRRVLEEYVKLDAPKSGHGDLDLSFLQVAGVDFGSLLRPREHAAVSSSVDQSAQSPQRRLNFVGANIPGASFRATDLRRANFRDAHLLSLA
jgi:hypothetical protein